MMGQGIIVYLVFLFNVASSKKNICVITTLIHDRSNPFTQVIILLLGPFVALEH